MKEILFLVHRIPWPPNKGDKIRAFHMLKWLTSHYRVHLAAFVDDADDWRHAEEVKQLCAETCLRPLNPTLARLRSVKGFLTREALTFPYYRDRAMREWVARLTKRHPLHAVIAFSACMAQYARNPEGAKRIIDFVDLDSDKWRQFAATRTWPWSWVYRREARKLAASELRIAADFDASLFVSEAEAELFIRGDHKTAARVMVMKNGVDTEFFSPLQRGASPYPRNTRAIAFTGAMDYWPNVDAATWFAHEIYPRIRECVADAAFYIVGTRPTAPVRALAELPGVRVTGAVPDVRPYIGHARVVVAPLRIARGVQNKVLEAMAMGRPVLMTPAARNGLEADPLCDSLVAHGSRDLAERIIGSMNDLASPATGGRCRRFVERHYDWNRNLDGLAMLLGDRTELGSAIAEAI